MTSVKVSYQSTVRRFTISPDTLTWSSLESKLREIFSLQPSFKFYLSYCDEEGDIITLSTDLELQDFLSSQSPQSTLKFTLTPEKQQQPFVDTFSSNVSENDFVSIEKSVEKERFIHDNHVLEKTDDIVTVDEPSFEPTIPSVSKGKQKEESPSETSTFATNEQQQEEKQENPSPNSNEQRIPFTELAEQFQGLLDQFKDVLSKNPQLVEQANTIMEKILQNVPVDINQWAQWLNTFRPESDTQSNNSQGEENQQQRREFGQFPSFFPPPHSLLSNPWIQQIVQDACSNYPGRFSNSFENFARPTGFNGRCNPNGNGNGCPFQQQQQQELSQEELREKIVLLHSMGFWEDDVKNEELLKRYNGNIERVVEILTRQ